MKVVYSRPPLWIYNRAVKEFGVSMESGAIFAYGNHVFTYNELTPDLIVHESTHLEQQRHLSPQLWWSVYFDSPSFRLEQELEAYRNQYKFIVKNIKDRNQQNRYLDFFAKVLSNMYGGIIDYYSALKQIKNT